MGTILIEGIEALGVHGVLAEERERAQPFRIDIELDVDLARAGETDDLDDTVDYGAVTEDAAAVVRDESFQLLERLAARIGDVCLRDRKVTRAVVTVRKLRPPIAESVAAVGVRVEATR